MFFYSKLQGVIFWSASSATFSKSKLYSHAWLSLLSFCWGKVLTSAKQDVSYSSIYKEFESAENNFQQSGLDCNVSYFSHIRGKVQLQTSSKASSLPHRPSISRRERTRSLFASTNLSSTFGLRYSTKYFSHTLQLPTLLLRSRRSKTRNNYTTKRSFSLTLKILRLCTNAIMLFH